MSEKPGADIQTALASFTQWFWQTHPAEYGVWKAALQKTAQSAVSEKDESEDESDFQERLWSMGPEMFQSAMNDVSRVMEGTECWATWAPSQKKLAMRATQKFLIRHFQKRGWDLIGQPSVTMVDERIHAVSRALAASLELDHWKFSSSIKHAVSQNQESFARLRDAAEPLSNLEFYKSLNGDPLLVLECMKQFSKGVIDFLTTNDMEANMDSQVDVALYTIAQLAPTALFYHLKVAESLVWRPWLEASEEQFSLIFLTSVVMALYTINTSHFDMDSTLFLGIMASHGFNPAEFMPRAQGTASPPPFGQGPALGEGLAENSHISSSYRDTSSASRTSAAQRGGAESVRAAQDATEDGRRERATESVLMMHARSMSPEHRKMHARTMNTVARLERAGASIVDERGLSHNLARNYPFLLQNPEDLFLKDVGELLEQYQGLVLKYEGLKSALQAEGFR